jgi:integrase
MGVKIRKRGDQWYVFVDYRGRRKAKCVGTKKAAEEVKRRLEAKFALGDLGFLSERTRADQTFKHYAERWLKAHVQVECKYSTWRSYEQLLRLHVTPRFGEKRLPDITRDSIKAFVAELSGATRIIDKKAGTTAPRFSRNTLRLIVCALRAVLNAAVEDGVLESNPAARIGRFAKSEKPDHQTRAMTREEADRFLTAVGEVCPEWFPFFLTALRTGLRKGELIALKWGDIQFGQGPEDSHRYILLQRNYSHGRFTSPKSKKPRRVDLSRQLRAVLLDLRDSRLLGAMMAGKTGIADDLVFPCSSWDEEGSVWLHGRGTEPLKPDNIVPRYMEPALEKAGLRRFRFHDLRHTFGSLLIQDGASLAYVKEQMGHSSIQITVDTYGHLIPGADIAWVDRLDGKTTPQQSATQTQPAVSESEQDDTEVLEKIWLPPRDSNPDMLIQSQLSCH